MTKPRLQADLPDGDLDEGYAELRANLLAALGATERAVVVVTSPHAAEPRRRVAAHLAAALTPSGRRVWLLDADAGETATDAEVDAAPDAPDGLFMSTSPAVTAGDPALLSAPADLAELRVRAHEHDVTIVAAPPLLDAPDARALAARADGVLLVVVHGHSNRDDAVRARAVLAQVGATLLGAVVVQV